jgi:membrane-associated phospholipid phosphatase|nr:phosphatase PAP2 family protein [uncultured Acetatifactor sp.]
MKRLRKILDALIPRYGRIPLIVAVAWNMTVYFGSRLIAGDWPHHNIEGELDKLIPLVPWTVAIYLGCYLFWIVNYILIARQGKREVCQFFAADFLSRAVCLAFYLLYPTTNIRPVVEPEGLWNQVVIGLYATDAADNLFPSIHCLVSWFCYIGLRGKNSVPKWYRVLSCLLALAVCISTLTTRQHVIADVAGGIALAEICLFIGKKTKVWSVYERILNKMNRRLSLEGEDSCVQRKK